MPVERVITPPDFQTTAAGIARLQQLEAAALPEMVDIVSLSTRRLGLNRTDAQILAPHMRREADRAVAAAINTLPPEPRRDHFTQAVGTLQRSLAYGGLPYAALTTALDIDRARIYPVIRTQENMAPERDEIALPFAALAQDSDSGVKTLRECAVMEHLYQAIGDAFKLQQKLNHHNALTHRSRVETGTANRASDFVAYSYLSESLAHGLNQLTKQANEFRTLHAPAHTTENLVITEKQATLIQEVAKHIVIVLKGAETRIMQGDARPVEKENHFYRFVSDTLLKLTFENDPLRFMTTSGPDHEYGNAWAIIRELPEFAAADHTEARHYQAIFEELALSFLQVRAQPAAGEEAGTEILERHVESPLCEAFTNTAWLCAAYMANHSFLPALLESSAIPMLRTLPARITLQTTGWLAALAMLRRIRATSAATVRAHARGMVQSQLAHVRRAPQLEAGLLLETIHHYQAGASAQIDRQA